MIDRCFESPLTLRRLAEGPAGPFLDGFAEALVAQRYSLDARRRYLRTASHFGEWAARSGTKVVNLDEDSVARFVRHLSRHRRRGNKYCRYSRAPFQARRFLRYLRESGVVASCAPDAHQSAMVIEFVAWMRDQRGLTAGSIAGIVRKVQAFLDAMGEDPERFDAIGLRTFVLSYARQHAPFSAGLVTTSIRCFLRYLVARGQCSPDLIAAVPRLPTWSMTRLPRYLPSDDVERVIAACEHHNGTALRNHALLLLLARLGLRANEVMSLRLGDIDWREGRLRVLGKGGREARLPLPQDAGDAILRYLKTGRPAAATDLIFLTSCAPMGPLGTSGLRGVIRRAIKRAGVRAPSHGAHLLRHSLATRLLREGATLDAIGAVLRHRSVDTTAIYAKVDVDLLRQVAQPWPGAEVSPC